MVLPEILRLITQARRSFSDALVCSGISGRSSTRSSSPLKYAKIVAATDYQSRASNENFIKKPDTRLISHHPTGAGFDGSPLAPKTRIE
jgi:hypothetical protein